MYKYGITDLSAGKKYQVSIPNRSVSTRKSTLTINTVSSHNSLWETSTDSSDSDVPRRLIKGLPDLRMMKFAQKMKIARQLTIQRLEQELAEEERQQQAQADKDRKKAEIEAEEAEAEAQVSLKSEQEALVAEQLTKSPKKEKPGFFKAWRVSMASIPSSAQSKKSDKTASSRQKKGKGKSTPSSEREISYPVFHDFSWDVQDALARWQRRNSLSIEDHRKHSGSSGSKPSAKAEDIDGASCVPRPLLLRHPAFASSHMCKKRANSVPTTLASIDELNVPDSKRLSVQLDLIPPATTTSSNKSIRSSYHTARASISSSCWNRGRTKPITSPGMPVLYPFNVVGPPTHDPEEAGKEWSSLVALNRRRKSSESRRGSAPAKTLDPEVGRKQRQSADDGSAFEHFPAVEKRKSSASLVAKILQLQREEEEEDSDDEPCSSGSLIVELEDDLHLQQDSRAINNSFAGLEASRNIPDHLQTSPLCPLNMEHTGLCLIHRPTLSAKRLKL